MQAISQQWADQARTDKEFGGENGENLALAKRALDAYATPELVEPAERFRTGQPSRSDPLPWCAQASRSVKTVL